METNNKLNFTLVENKGTVYDANNRYYSLDGITWLCNLSVVLDALKHTESNVYYVIKLNNYDSQPPKLGFKQLYGRIAEVVSVSKSKLRAYELRKIVIS